MKYDVGNELGDLCIDWWFFPYEKSRSMVAKEDISRRNAKIAKRS